MTNKITHSADFNFLNLIKYRFYTLSFKTGNNKSEQSGVIALSVYFILISRKLFRVLNVINKICIDYFEDRIEGKKGLIFLFCSIKIKNFSYTTKKF